jgi:hypothetical protein
VTESTRAARVNDDPDLTLLLRASAEAVKEDPKAAKARFKAAACENCGVQHRNRTADECRDRSMSEKVLQDRIVDRAKRRGWRLAHAGRGIAAYDAAGNPVFVTPMAKGWPDLFLLHPESGRSLVIECKSEVGEPSDEQIEWLQAFNACGIPAILVRPSDLREGRVNEILKRR